MDGLKWFDESKTWNQFDVVWTFRDAYRQCLVQVWRNAGESRVQVASTLGKQWIQVEDPVPEDVEEAKAWALVMWRMNGGGP